MTDQLATQMTEQIIAQPPPTDQLVNQRTTRATRKVEFSSNGGGIGALAGAVFAAYTFPFLPDAFEQVPLANELWVGLWAGGIAKLAAFQIGYRVKERLENMLPLPQEPVQ
jgi:ABC-type branched-subunit amino acid transport system permease subunit